MGPPKTVWTPDPGAVGGRRRAHGVGTTRGARRRANPARATEAADGDRGWRQRRARRPRGRGRRADEARVVPDRAGHGGDTQRRGACGRVACGAPHGGGYPGYIALSCSATCTSPVTPWRGARRSDRPHAASRGGRPARLAAHTPTRAPRCLARNEGAGRRKSPTLSADGDVAWPGQNTHRAPHVADGAGHTVAVWSAPPAGAAACPYRTTARSRPVGRCATDRWVMGP